MMTNNISQMTYDNPCRMKQINNNVLMNDNNDELYFLYNLN